MLGRRRSSARLEIFVELFKTCAGVRVCVCACARGCLLTGTARPEEQLGIPIQCPKRACVTHHVCHHELSNPAVAASWIKQSMVAIRHRRRVSRLRSTIATAVVWQCTSCKTSRAHKRMHGPTPVTQTTVDNRIRVITVESLHSMRGVSVSLAAWLHSGAWGPVTIQAWVKRAPPGRGLGLSRRRLAGAGLP